jgi:hypothetical protein
MGGAGRQVSGRFFEKKLRKKLLLLQPVLISPSLSPGQKFFAALFFKKARSYFLT